MSHAPSTRLVLDEMFSPAIATALRDLGHDVIAIAEQPGLGSMTDEELFAWATAENRWLLTENVRDFRPIMQRALQAGTPAVGLLFTSSRSFPRSRKNPGPLVQALDAWLAAGSPGPRSPKHGSWPREPLIRPSDERPLYHWDGYWSRDCHQNPFGISMFACYLR